MEIIIIGSLGLICGMSSIILLGMLTTALNETKRYCKQSAPSWKIIALFLSLDAIMMICTLVAVIGFLAWILGYIW